MNDLMRLGFGIVLLLMALSLALSYLAGPMAIARKSGAVKAGSRMLKASWRSVVGLVRVLTKSRRPRIRRPAGPSPVRRVR